MTVRHDTLLSHRIDSTVRMAFVDRTIPGASVAVLRRDTLLHIGAYGVAHLERRMPVADNTIFQIASLTKPFTAMAILLLEADGKVRLDDPASRYVATLPAIYSAITIRQLLTHTSGVNPDMRRANVDEMEISEFWKRLADRPASFAPGANIQYANAGYTILAFVVEEAAGIEFGEFLRQRIFAPLGMRSTAYRVPQQRDTRHAVGYDLVEGRNVEAPHVFSGWGNSGIETTIEDLVRFSVAIEGQSLLPAGSYQQMFSAGKLSTGAPASFSFGGVPSHYGFGWFLTTYKGRALHTHGGAIAGFSSILNRFPDDGYTILVLSNGKQGADRLGQADGIARAVAAILGISDLREEIDSLNRAMESAFNKGDLLGVSRFYADDARLMGPRRNDIQSRAAIDAYWTGIRGAKSWKLDVLEVGGDRRTVYQVGRSTLVTAGPNGDQTSVSRFVVIWRRHTDGHLRIHLDFYHF